MRRQKEQNTNEKAGLSGRPDIAIFLPFLGGRGAQRVMLNLANGFASEGVRVDLVLAEARGEFLDKVSPSVRLVDLKSTGGVLRSIFAFRRYLRKERPAVLLTAMDYINVIAILVRAISSRRTKLFISCHNSLLNATRNSRHSRDRLLPFAVRLFYRFADGIIAVSGGVADTVENVTRLPRTRIKVLHNPVVNPGFESDALEHLDHVWFNPNQPPVILGVGQLTKQKDFRTLIQAFGLVRKKTTCRLLILGEGEDRNALEELVKRLGMQNSVLLPGWVSNPYAYMAKSGVFVLSSRWEGFGLVLAEALACGTPVVSTNCPSGPSEILKDGKIGKLVPINCPETMAEAIYEALSHTHDRELLRRRGYDFSLGKVVAEYMDYFYTAKH